MNISKHLIIIILSLTLIKNDVAIAATSTCEQRVAKCEDVLEHAIGYINDLENEGAQLRALLPQKDAYASSLEKELVAMQPSWYEKPAVVLPAGMVIGALIITSILKNSK